MNAIKLNIFLKYFHSDVPLNIGCNEITLKGVANHQNDNKNLLKGQKYSGKILTIMDNVKILLLFIMVK